MKTIQVYLQFGKRSINNLIERYGLNKEFILNNDDQFFDMVMVGDEDRMKHDWEMGYIKCEVAMDVILQYVLYARLENPHATFKIKVLDNVYHPANSI